jgi:hypothetical protein
LALGDKGINTTKAWENSYPSFHDASVHSNSGIQFKGTESFTGESPVTAVDSIGGASVGTTGVNEVEIRPVDWDDLYQRAQENGDIYKPEDWTLDLSEYRKISFGNEIKKTADNTFFFLPAAGDHEGRVYYFESSEAFTVYIAKPSEYDRKSYHFTLAFENVAMIRTWGDAKSNILILGGEGEDAVHIYTNKGDNTGDFIFQDRSGGWTVLYRFDGVFIRHHGPFVFYTNGSAPSPSYHKLRVIADDIEFRSSNNLKGLTVFDGLFGPPCPPKIVRLGRLTPSGS